MMSTLDRPQRVSATEAEARINPYSPDSSLSFEDSGEEAPTKELRVRRSKELRILTRERLFDCIRGAIKRDIFQRGKKQVDPRRDDLEPPNLYKWTFTKQYPCFPREATGRWSLAENEACLNALNQGWVSVLALATPAVDALSVPHEHSDVENGSENQGCISPTNDGSHENASNQDTISQSIKHVEERIGAGDGILSLRESFSKIHDLIIKEGASHRKAGELLEIHRKHILGINDKLFDTTISKNHLLDDVVRNQNFRYQELESRFEELKGRYDKVYEENLTLKQKLESYTNDAEQKRELGEIQELYTEIECLRNDGKAIFQSHLTQMKKATQQGILHGEASVLSKSAALTVDLERELEVLDQQLEDLRTQLEKNQASHAFEVNRAKEEGKREEESLSRLLKGHNLHYEGRKRRNIRTIYSIWKNIPQNILPKLILADGGVLGDKTLILLARLSRAEHDPQKAATMLQRVIEHRNSQLAVARKDPVITNADIENVLSNLGDVECGQRNSETSSTSQTELSQDFWSFHKLRPYIVDSHQAVSSSYNFEEIYSATPSSQVEDDNPTALAGLRRSSIQYQRLSKPLLQRETTETKKSTFMDNFTQGLGRTDQGQLATGEMDTASTTNCTIENKINSLPVPHKSLIPPSLEHFPMAFLRDSVGGNNSIFAKCSRNLLDKQLVAWPEMIKLNPEYHPVCPTQGRNGALTFVAGRRNTGEIGKTYPILLKEKVNFYKYIGHYKVLEHIIMPIATWKSYKLEERLAIAKEIQDKEWGQTLLTKKGLRHKHFSDILGFFEKPQEPCLRMSWTLLQFDSFELDDYNLLLDTLKQQEMEQDPEKAPGEDPEDDFESYASSFIPEMRSRFLNSQSLGQDNQDRIHYLDGLPSPVSTTRNNAEQRSHNTIKSNKSSNRHNDAGASGVANGDMAVASEVHSCGQVTGRVNDSSSDEGEFPEFLARAGDCPRHGRVNPIVTSVTEQQSPQIHTLGIPAERLDEEDIYGVSPPRVTGGPSKVRPSIFSRFAKDMKRKYSVYVEDASDNGS